MNTSTSIYYSQRGKRINCCVGFKAEEEILAGYWCQCSGPGKNLDGKEKPQCKGITDKQLRVFVNVKFCGTTGS